MITKAGFTFELKSNKTEDGSYGPLLCTLCKSKSTMLLEITDLGNHEYNSTITVCKSCLSWMIELIDRSVIDEIKKSQEEKQIVDDVVSSILIGINTKSFMRTLMEQ